MNLEICKCECASCGNEFYEWEDECLKECPHCKENLAELNSANVIETQIVTVELDPITGTVIVPPTA